MSTGCHKIIILLAECPDGLFQMGNIPGGIIYHAENWGRGNFSQGIPGMSGIRGLFRGIFQSRVGGVNFQEEMCNRECPEERPGWEPGSRYKTTCLYVHQL